MVAHVCHPSYSGSRDREDHSYSHPGQKKLTRLHLNRKKLGMVTHSCHPSYGRKYKIG
jgi:hypothetical protein